MISLFHRFCTKRGVRAIQDDLTACQERLPNELYETAFPSLTGKQLLCAQKHRERFATVWKGRSASGSRGWQPPGDDLQCGGRQNPAANPLPGAPVDASTPSETHKPAIPAPTASSALPSHTPVDSGSPVHSSSGEKPFLSANAGYTPEPRARHPPPFPPSRW